MLRINLIPVRQLKKRAKARNQIFGCIFALGCLMLLCGLIGFIQNRKIAAVEDNIKELTREKDSYAPQLAKIAENTKIKEELERKNKVIDSLKTDSSLTVRVLDEVASKVDHDRLWLDSLTQQSSSLKLTGISLDNESVAQFMDNLKLSPFIRDVELADSLQKMLAGRDLKSFTLNCVIGVQEKEQPPASAPNQNAATAPKK